MKLVKLTQDRYARRKGEVLEVDDASAKNLIVGGFAAAFDPETDQAEAERTAPRIGNATAVQVADEDVPPQPVRAEGIEVPVGETAELVGDGSGEKLPDVDNPEGTTPLDPPSEHDHKHELVARLVEVTANTAEPVTPEQANQLTKPELVARLNQLARQNNPSAFS